VWVASHDPQLTVWPQLSVAGPHVAPAAVQAAVAPSGTQQLFALAPPTPQGVVAAQVSVHATVPPHPSGTDPQATPAHAVAALAGAQQRLVPVSQTPLQHWVGPVQLSWPELPQQAPAVHVWVAAHDGHSTVWPQLSVTGPHVAPACVQAAVAPSGAQQLFAPAPPTPQGVVAPQVFGHVIVPPQVSETDPQATPAQACVAVFGTQHAPALQTPLQQSDPCTHVAAVMSQQAPDAQVCVAALQVSGHVMVPPQPSEADPHATPVQA